MVEIKFVGSQKSNSQNRHLNCFCNDQNEIYISIEQYACPEIWVALDKATAIKLSKELRKQIALIENEAAH